MAKLCRVLVFPVLADYNAAFEFRLYLTGNECAVQEIDIVSHEVRGVKLHHSCPPARVRLPPLSTLDLTVSVRNGTFFHINIRKIRYMNVSIALCPVSLI